MKSCAIEAAASNAFLLATARTFFQASTGRNGHAAAPREGIRGRRRGEAYGQSESAGNKLASSGRNGNGWVVDYK